MKRLLFVAAAAVPLLAAVPASAQIGFEVGPFAFGVGPHYWHGPYRGDWDGPYAYDDGYGYGCRNIRERFVTPSGRIIFRTRRYCD